MAELITATKNFPHLVPESVLESGRVRTYDGYVWFWCPMFKLGVRSSLALVAFPWCQDFKKLHGTQSDRHMTVYARGPVPMDELNMLLKKMTGSLQAHIRKHPRKLTGTLAAYV